MATQMRRVFHSSLTKTGWIVTEGGEIVSRNRPLISALNSSLLDCSRLNIRNERLFEARLTLGTGIGKPEPRRDRPKCHAPRHGRFAGAGARPNCATCSPPSPQNWRWAKRNAMVALRVSPTRRWTLAKGLLLANLDGDLQFHRVGRTVNSVKNQGADCIELINPL